MDAPLPRRGRAAAVNPVGRFPRLDTSLDPAALSDEERQRAETVVLRDTTRTALARNDSPDLPFTFSLNPYRGCEHGCPYCLGGDTRVLLADGRSRPIRDVRPGDAVLGTVRRGHYRRLVETTVLDQWETRKPAVRVRLADGTGIVASGDHRFWTDRGWKHVTGANHGHERRPHLTTRNRLLGPGASALTATPVATAEYRRGYLAGMIHGDGHVGTYVYDGRRRARDVHHRFRLALVDSEALDRAAAYLSELGVETRRYVFAEASPGRKRIEAVRASAEAAVGAVREGIELPDRPSPEWGRGFLAGLFDAEGSYSGGALRISNTDRALLCRAAGAFEAAGFDVVVEDRQRVAKLRLRGGLAAHLRFFAWADPAIARKRSVAGVALKQAGDRRVVAIEPLGLSVPMFDLTTGTGDFLAEGVVAHNCFARPSHEYLGFSAGLDFETRIVAKPELPRLLAEALQKPSWRPQTVALSGNTDPYQPVERKLEITRGCLEVLLRHRNPVGLITKNALVTRDLDVLRELAALDLVRVTLSITTLRDALAGPMEPRASRPAARLRAVEALAEAGVPVGVNAAPLIPGLTDEELPAILRAAADAGATSAGYMMVRLPGAVREVFEDWLRRTLPDRADRVLNRIREGKGSRLNDPRFGHRFRSEGPYADAVRQVFRAEVRRLGLNRERPPLATHHFRRLAAGQMDLF